MAKQQYDYNQALADLDRARDEGRLTPAQYDLHKKKLIDEATAKPRSAAVTFLIWAGVIVGIIVVLRIANVVFAAFMGQ